MFDNKSKVSFGNAVRKYQYQIYIIFPETNCRRSNEVVPDTGDAGNQAGSETDKEKQGDCQRAKQVPMNPGTGT